MLTINNDRKSTVSIFSFHWNANKEKQQKIKQLSYLFDGIELMRMIVIGRHLGQTLYVYI